MTIRELPLKVFVTAADPANLRVLHREGAWVARCGDLILVRPDGTTCFSEVTQLLGVLASVGIRCCLIEWDGLQPVLDTGGTSSRPVSAHLND